MLKKTDQPRISPSFPSCGHEDVPHQAISRHRTSQGEVVYARCLCGTLLVTLLTCTDSESADVRRTVLHESGHASALVSAAGPAR
jgi:hypothetical protein